MTDVFDDMLADLVGSDLSMPALVTPAGGGSPSEIRVLPSSADIERPFGDGRLRRPTLSVEARAADLPTEPTGATLTLDGTDYRVQDARRGTNGRTRILDLVPAS